MSIWDKMQELTSNKTKEVEIAKKELLKAQSGDILRGVITNLVLGDDTKKGGYGFISSEQLPFERVFFHWSGLQQATLRFPDLHKRMKVEFQLQHDEFNGYRAIKIIVLK